MTAILGYINRPKDRLSTRHHADGVRRRGWPGQADQDGKGNGPVLPSDVGHDARPHRRARGQGVASRAKTSPARSCDGMD